MIASNPIFAEINASNQALHSLRTERNDLFLTQMQILFMHTNMSRLEQWFLLKWEYWFREQKLLVIKIDNQFA